MPPARNAAATRERLLEYACKRFVHESYENVGLREIARDAGVDVALVGRYFGSKEQLFKDVLHRTNSDWQTLAGEAEDLPSFLAHLVTDDLTSSTVHVERLLIMLRSASSPQASALVRASFGEDVLDPLSRLLSGPNQQLRAAMALTVLVGTTFMRTIMNLEVVHDCDRSKLRESLTAVLTTALADQSLSPAEEA